MRKPVCVLVGDFVTFNNNGMSMKVLNFFFMNIYNKHDISGPTRHNGRRGAVCVRASRKPAHSTTRSN